MADWFDQNAPASGSYNLDAAIAKVQQATGKTLSSSDVDALLAKFGGDRSSTFSDSGLAPVIDYVKSSAFGPNYGNANTPPDIYKSNPNAPAYTPLPTPTALQTPYVAPTFGEGRYTDPEKPASLQTPYALPTKPASLQTEYTLPTQAELEASPGYETRRAAGQAGLERSAASRGTVLSGGTQQAVGRYNQDYASNEYGNYVNQSLAARGQNVGEYGQDVTQSLAARGQNVGEYNADASRAFQNYSSRYGQFLDSANLNLGARQQNVGEFNTAQTQNNTAFQNRYQSYLDENARLLTNYTTNVNTQRNYNNDYWQHLNDLYQGGQGAATGSYRAPL